MSRTKDHGKPRSFIYTAFETRKTYKEDFSKPKGKKFFKTRFHRQRRRMDKTSILKELSND